MYQKPNQKIIEKYLNIYQNHTLHDCIIGLRPECRIYNRDSYLTCITDPDVFLDCVIYPLYVDGECNIQDLMIKEIDYLIASNNPIEFFQGICYLCSEKILKKIYGELPFCMFDENKIHFVQSRLIDMKDKMILYREDDFGKYNENMYDMANRILNCSLFFLDKLMEDE